MNDELEFEKEFPSFFKELDLNELSEERCMCGYVIGSNEIDMTNGYFKCPRCQEENAFQSHGVDLYAKHNVKSYLKDHCVDKKVLYNMIDNVIDDLVDNNESNRATAVGIIKGKLLDLYGYYVE